MKTLINSLISLGVVSRRVSMMVAFINDLNTARQKKSKQIVERDNGEAQIFQDCAYVPHGAEQGGKQTATDVNEGECDGKVEPIGLIEK